jgi:pyridoxine 5''-phosphate synthase
MKRLGVNIDHVATLRNARGDVHPDPLLAAKFAMKIGADSITVHLREDRRHINDKDLFKICKNKKIPLNLEIAANMRMVKIALKNKPNFICIVPENRKEITTEGGLNLKKNRNKIKKILLKLKKSKIRSSLFINPNINDIKLSKKLNSDCVELHTGKISNLIKLKKNFSKELEKIKNCAKFGDSIGLEIHAGHGMDYKTTKILNKISEIKEFNIGHFIIGESIFYGFKNVIRKINKILKK